MKVIGITGGIGSGKSEVLKHMQKEYGAVICETDKTAHQLQEKGTECYKKIVKFFGPDILDEEEKINRKCLGNIVFSNPQKMEKLNQIVHPSVKQYVKEQIELEKQKGTQYFIIESALLLEDHYELICDEIWYIYVEEKIRRKRLKKSRDITDEKITAIISAQSDEQTLRNYSDVVIDNSGSFEETISQIEIAINRRQIHEIM